MQHSNSILPDTSNRDTVGAPAPLPLAHLTMTERFFVYEAALRAPVLLESVASWALAVGILGRPQDSQRLERIALEHALQEWRGILDARFVLVGQYEALMRRHDAIVSE